MTMFTPSAAQGTAIAEVRHWFETQTNQKQVFRLFGYAGSGKSTVLKFALDDLGLSPHRSAKDGPSVPGVVTATFTGKAALVLNRKGTPARTIHSLIYSVIESTEEEVTAAARKVQEAEAAARKLTGFDRTAAEAGIEAMRQALSAMKHPRFALNPQSDAADAKLIVLDEVSMVGEDMARDLMSFGKPILVLGDPGQLPPIKGEGAFTREVVHADPLPNRRHSTERCHEDVLRRAVDGHQVPARSARTARLGVRPVRRSAHVLVAAAQNGLLRVARGTHRRWGALGRALGRCETCGTGHAAGRAGCAGICVGGTGRTCPEADVVDGAATAPAQVSLHCLDLGQRQLAAV